MRSPMAEAWGGRVPCEPKKDVPLQCKTWRRHSWGDSRDHTKMSWGVSRGMVEEGVEIAVGWETCLKVFSCCALGLFMSGCAMFYTGAGHLVWLTHWILTFLTWLSFPYVFLYKQRPSEFTSSSGHDPLNVASAKTQDSSKSLATYSALIIKLQWKEK